MKILYSLRRFYHVETLFNGTFVLAGRLCSCRRRPWPASPTSSTSTSPTPRRRSSPSTYGTYGNVLLVNPHATPLLPRRPERTDLAGRRPPFSWRFGVWKRALAGRRVGTKDLWCVRLGRGFGRRGVLIDYRLLQIFGFFFALAGTSGASISCCIFPPFFSATLCKHSVFSW